MERIKVAVIGAGVAGLRCAAILAKDPRVEVTIIEARDRVGGRIVQDSRLGIPIDTGANWIHDVAQTLHGDQNPITALCLKLGIETHQWNDETIIIDRDGRALPKEICEQSMADLWAVWGEAAKHSRRHFSTKSVSSSISLRDFLLEKIDSRLAQSCEQNGTGPHDRKDVVRGLIESWGTYTGEAVENQSLRYYYIEACDESDEFVVDTYGPLVEALLSDALSAGADLQLNTEMTALHSQPPGSSTGAGKVQVQTKDAKTDLQFDHAVLTAPLGWLKKNAVRCIHPLDASLEASIRRSSFGRLEKILVKFPHAFWDDGRSMPLSFLQWLPSKHLPWKMEAISLAAFKPTKSAPILMFYIFGDCSEYVCSKTKGKSQAERTRFLKEFMMPYIDSIPGYDTVYAPSEMVSSSWSTDELSLGSYTTFKTRCESGAEDIDTMRKGMPEAGVWLAGEHTAPLDGVGSVYGAYASGEAVAERLLGILE